MLRSTHSGAMGSWRLFLVTCECVSEVALTADLLVALREDVLAVGFCCRPCSEQHEPLHVGKTLSHVDHRSFARQTAHDSRTCKLGNSLQ
mmetsp:Transcript_9996/g.30529  ORF Transcript_9996/g.30529 Transcript_9996/m.30529 type:complete len:90 (+) Transcript_9996:1020-1289(+)